MDLDERIADLQERVAALFEEIDDLKAIQERQDRVFDPKIAEQGWFPIKCGSIVGYTRVIEAGREM